MEFESAEIGECGLASVNKIKYFVFTTHPNEYDLKYKINAPCSWNLSLAAVILTLQKTPMDLIDAPADNFLLTAKYTHNCLVATGGKYSILEHDNIFFFFYCDFKDSCNFQI